MRIDIVPPISDVIYTNYEIGHVYKVDGERTDLKSYGRLLLYIKNLETGKWTSISYPKYLMEVKLGKYLNENDTVDHLDYNVLNNEYDNLVVKNRSEHSKDDNIRIKPVRFICPICGKEFELSGKKLLKLYYRIKMGVTKSGPYCCRSCAGKGTNMKNIPLTKFDIEYTTNKIEREGLTEDGKKMLEKHKILFKCGNEKL